MVVFLAGDSDRIGELEHAVREYLGWSQIIADATTLNLNPEQLTQAQERQTKASETSDSRLLGAYQWALVPSGQPVEIQSAKVDGQTTALAERVSRKLGNDGALATQHAAAAIRHQLDTHADKLWEPGHLSVGELWRLYAEYPYMPRLKSRAVLNAGLTGPQLLWEEEGFALADGVDEAGHFRGLVLPADGVSVAVTDSTLVVKPAIAKAQRDAELAAAVAGEGTDAVPSSGAIAPQPDLGDGPGPPTTPRPTRYFGSKQFDAAKVGPEVQKLYAEVLAPLLGTPGASVNVTIEIEATATEGFDDAKVRTVSENATTLKFEQSGFEED